MADEKREPTQRTQPKGRDEKGEPAKPMNVPVPKRSEFDRLLGKAEKQPEVLSRRRRVARLVNRVRGLAYFIVVVVVEVAIGFYFLGESLTENCGYGGPWYYCSGPFKGIVTAAFVAVPFVAIWLWQRGMPSRDAS